MIQFADWHFSTFNPLSANDVYTPDDTVVTLDSCNCRHSENYETFFDILCNKSLKFYTKKVAIKKFCNLVDPFLRNCVTDKG